MSEWVELKLTDVGSLQRGKSKHRPRYAFHLYNGKYPFIQTGEVRESRKYISEFKNTYSEAGLAQSKLWPKNTLCITIAANIAELGILKFDACFPDSVIGFIPDKNKSNLDFVYYTLCHFQRELKHLGEGSVQDNINLGTFNDIKFMFPSLAEQKAITSVLSSLDDKIDLLHHQNKTLESMAETLFRQWFVEEAQDDWDVYSLEEVSTISIGRTPPRKNKHLFSSDINDVKWLSIKDMGKSGIYRMYTEEYLPKSTIESFKIPIIPTNTVVLSFKMTVGRVGITHEEMVSNEAIAQFNIKKIISTEFLYCFLKQYNYDSLGTTSSIVTSINTGLIKSIQFSIPNDTKVAEFTQRTKPFFEKVKKNQMEIQTLEKLRDTLLPKLMSGEVRVNYTPEEIKQ
ncbi:restriction endonuclease subunit S [Proteus mirabilis]|nr:restriction endonuclease subunit S [Proteus mirabilis]